MLKSKKVASKSKLLHIRLRALLHTARKLNYKVRLVDGEGGSHQGFIPSNRYIYLGKDQSLINKVIILAHEVGHALDLAHNPADGYEMFDIIINPRAYECSQKNFDREVEAWKRAEKLLQSMNSLRLVEPKFSELKTTYLNEYKQGLKNLVGTGTKSTSPTS